MPRVITDPISIQTKPNDTYLLTITYGGGVIGGSSSFVDFNNNLQNSPITNFPLGSGSQISGKTLHVVSTLTANTPAGTFVSVIYKINEKSFVRKKQIGDDILFTFETDIIFN